MAALRVAYINSVAGFGSTGRIVDQLSSMDGIEGMIFYGRKADMAKNPAYRFTKAPGNAKHILMTFLNDRHGFYNSAETRNLNRQISEFHPDLIHLHNLHGYYLDIATLFPYLKQTGVPVIWTLHDCWSFTGHCAHYESIPCEKWKTLCQDCPALLRYPPTWSGKSVTKNYLQKKQIFNSLGSQLTIVTPSNWLAGQVRMSFLGMNTIRTIHNGISISDFHRSESGFRTQQHIENKFMILACASTWYKEKGLNDLAEFSHMINKSCVLVVIGLRMEQKLRFSKDTIFISHIESKQEMSDVYSAADVFLNLSLEDTFPTVNLEAQACGCPVITYQTGGCPETVSRSTGIVVEKGNLISVLQNINDLQAKKTTFQKSECEKWAAGFSLDHMCNEYMKLYQTTAGNNHDKT